MYNNSDYPTIADARAKHWKCLKCKETFDNYRELEITRIVHIRIKIKVKRVWFKKKEGIECFLTQPRN